MYQIRTNWLISIIIFIALSLIMGIIIGIMGKRKKLWVICLILLIIYALTINPFIIYSFLSGFDLI